jgi:hypothetical protein
MQSYREARQRTVTAEQRPLVFGEQSTERFGYYWYYIDGHGIIQLFIVLFYFKV